MRLSEQLELLEQQSSDSSRKVINQNQMQKQQLIKLLQEIIIRLLEFSVTERKSNMCSDVKITQKVLPGAGGNTVVANQNNYGLTVTEATQMAFQIFREYYPQLQKEALEAVQKLTEERLKMIPTENIVPPKANVVVPVLQNASLTEEQDLLEMYATVLANSMDKFTKEGIHPGFVEIIKQLSSDEAKILRYMHLRTTLPIITLRFEDEKGAGFDVIKNYSDVGELINCVALHNIGLYFDNLQRLGLISIDNTVALLDKNLYAPLKNNEYILDEMKQAKDRPDQNKAVLKEGVVVLSDYGKAFCKACVTIQLIVMVKEPT